MPGKWGARARHAPPRSANELGCQANGGARAGHAPPLDPPMVLHLLTGLVLDLFLKTFHVSLDTAQITLIFKKSRICLGVSVLLSIWLPGPMFLLVGISVSGPLFLPGVSVQGGLCLGVSLL